MDPFFFQINKYPLMVIADVQLHLNGHSILAFTYNVYLDSDRGNPEQRLKKDLASKTQKLKDPDYFGYIIFHKKGGVYTYVPDGENRLNAGNVEELIEEISRVRNSPDLWQKYTNN